MGIAEVNYDRDNDENHIYIHGYSEKKLYSRRYFPSFFVTFLALSFYICTSPHLVLSSLPGSSNTTVVDIDHSSLPEGTNTAVVAEPIDEKHTKVLLEKLKILIIFHLKDIADMVDDMNKAQLRTNVIRIICKKNELDDDANLLEFANQCKNYLEKNSLLPTEKIVNDYKVEIKQELGMKGLLYTILTSIDKLFGSPDKELFDHRIGRIAKEYAEEIKILLENYNKCTRQETA